jgi:hypothetical protein
VVEGASLESLYMGNCIVGSNPISSANFFLTFVSMRLQYSILFFIFFFGAFAQEKTEVVKPVDSLYREDQFYVNFTYNQLQNFKGLTQTKFSPGFCVGILRDMPINKSRTFAIATGLGYSLNIFENNLLVNNAATGVPNSYAFLATANYNKNQFTLHYLDVPIEVRWRTSTPSDHQFWRIYTGFKMSYLVSDSYKFENGDQNNSIHSNPDLNKLVYGTYVAIGWNTWNLYAYYGLNSIFKSGVIDSQKINTNSFNIGLQFYIL